MPTRDSVSFACGCTFELSSPCSAEDLILCIWRLGFAPCRSQLSSGLLIGAPVPMMTNGRKHEGGHWSLALADIAPFGAKCHTSLGCTFSPVSSSSFAQSRPPRFKLSSRQR
jgi:hypothetical protein